MNEKNANTGTKVSEEIRKALMFPFDEDMQEEDRRNFEF